MSTTCQHLHPFQEGAGKIINSATGVCDACVETGSTWVHLRVCQTCGATLCCDSSKNKHATKHFFRSGHPVMASAEPGERWLWCYPDSEMLPY
jgi:uncharacterized UBP type Zn finger protein